MDSDNEALGILPSPEQRACSPKATSESERQALSLEPAVSKSTPLAKVQGSLRRRLRTRRWLRPGGFQAATLALSPAQRTTTPGAQGSAEQSIHLRQPETKVGNYTDKLYKYYKIIYSSNLQSRPQNVPRAWHSRSFNSGLAAQQFSPDFDKAAERTK